ERNQVLRQRRPERRPESGGGIPPDLSGISDVRSNPVVADRNVREAHYGVRDGRRVGIEVRRDEAEASTTGIKLDLVEPGNERRPKGSGIRCSHPSNSEAVTQVVRVGVRAHVRDAAISAGPYCWSLPCGRGEKARVSAR